MLNLACLYHRETQEIRVSGQKKREIGKAKVVDLPPPFPPAFYGRFGRSGRPAEILIPLSPPLSHVGFSEKAGRKEGRKCLTAYFYPHRVSAESAFQAYIAGPARKVSSPPPPPPLFPDTSVEKRLGRRPQAQVGPRRRVRRARQTLFHAPSRLAHHATQDGGGSSI